MQVGELEIQIQRWLCETLSQKLSIILKIYKCLLKIFFLELKTA